MNQLFQVNLRECDNWFCGRSQHVWRNRVLVISMSKFWLDLWSLNFICMAFKCCDTVFCECNVQFFFEVVHWKVKESVQDIDSWLMIPFCDSPVCVRNQIQIFMSHVKYLLMTDLWFFQFSLHTSHSQKDGSMYLLTVYAGHQNYWSPIEKDKNKVKERDLGMIV